jgi:FkbM family methyltransferase
MRIRQELRVINTIRYYYRLVGMRGLFWAIYGRITKKAHLLAISRREIRFPFFLRVPSSDVPTYRQIFFKRNYEFEVNRHPRIIIDAGANIGLASIFFSNKFPDARIIAIEPEESNWLLLQKNLSPYGNIVPVRAALWNENTPVDIVDPGFGKWAFRTRAQTGEDVADEIGQTVRGMTVDTLMKEQAIDHIDIFKIDIEGAEREVLIDPSSWIDKVDTLIIELHERWAPGCTRNFYNGTKGFDTEWKQGENIYVSRRTGCLTHRST